MLNSNWEYCWYTFAEMNGDRPAFSLRESIHSPLFLELELVVSQIRPQPQLSLFVDIGRRVARLWTDTLQLAQDVEELVQVILML